MYPTHPNAPNTPKTLTIPISKRNQHVPYSGPNTHKTQKPHKKTPPRSSKTSFKITPTPPKRHNTPSTQTPFAF